MDIRSRLAGGDRRSIGHSEEVVARLGTDPERINELIECLCHADPLIRMRAADAMEKASRRNRSLLQPHKPALLSLLVRADQPELRWHLAQMTPRLLLTEAERHLVFERLQTYLEDGSSIVKTFALQGLYELSCKDTELRPRVRAIVSDAIGRGTPAMRARGRKLLQFIDRSNPQAKQMRDNG